MAKPGPKPQPIEERFWRHVVKNGDNECWGWLGARTGPSKWKYGVLGRRDGGTTVASRISWEIHFGPIPDGMFACHHCDNPPCTNPKHLFLGTQLDNLRDASAKNRLSGWERPRTAANAKKTHCPRGHTYDDINTYRDRAGGRSCRTCSRAAQAKYKRMRQLYL